MSNLCCTCNNESSVIVLHNMTMRICDKCGLFWRNNDILSGDYYKTRTFEIENKKKLDDRYINFKSRIKLFRKYTDLNNLCDLGTGEGTFLQVLKDEGLKNMIGVEPSIHASDYANKHSLNIYQKKLEELRGDFLKEHNVKTLAMLHVIEHIKDPLKSISLLGKAMNSGDTLIIETPDWSSFVLKKNRNVHELVYPEHLFYFNHENLRLLLKRAGLSVVAEGNTDWNEENMSIKSSLIRLGFVAYSPPIENRCQDTYSAPRVEQPTSIIKKIIRKILSRLVRLFGRGNFMWIIAKKM